MMKKESAICFLIMQQESYKSLINDSNPNVRSVKIGNGKYSLSQAIKACSIAIEALLNELKVEEGAVG